MKSPAHRIPVYRFGAFEFDPGSGELRKHGLHVRLPQQSAKLLQALVQAQGRLCTREELRRELWPTDTFVAFEHSLNKAVWGLRQALGDVVTSPRYIETVAGQGYRFLVLSQRGTSRTRSLESLAVLPLANPDGAEECAFLAGQLACRLINTLCALPHPRVLAYSTVRRYSQATADPRTAGNELEVAAVLGGEILQRNGRLIISLELIDVADGTQIWGMQLEEAWPQAADIAERLAGELAQQLQPILARRRKRADCENKPMTSASPSSTIPVLKPRVFRAPCRTKKTLFSA